MNGKVKAGATPPLAVGTTPAINVSPLDFFSFCSGNFCIHAYIIWIDPFKVGAGRFTVVRSNPALRWLAGRSLRRIPGCTDYRLPHYVLFSVHFVAGRTHSTIPGCMHLLPPAPLCTVRFVGGGTQKFNPDSGRHYYPHQMHCTCMIALEEEFKSTG